MATQIAEPRYGLLRRIYSNLRSGVSVHANRLLLLAISVIFLQWNSTATTRAQEIWEFSPYRVQVWLSVDPALALSPQANARLERDLYRQLDLVFGPTWNTKIGEAPAWLRHTVVHDLENLQANVLGAGDFVMIVGKKKEKPDSKGSPDSKVSTDQKDATAPKDSPEEARPTDSVRSLESFVDKGFDVMVNRKTYESVMQRLVPDASATSFTRLRDLLKPDEKTSFQLVEAISKDEIGAALISKNDMQLRADDLRLITSIGDFALVVPRKNAKTENIENLDGFNELGIPVVVPQESYDVLNKRLKEDAITRLKSLLRPTDKTTAELATEVGTGKTLAAIVMKDDFARQSQTTRSIVVKFADQSDAFLDRHDKIYFAGLKMTSNGPQLQVREFDCPTRRLSNVYSRDIYHPTQLIAAPIAGLIRDSFTPVARIEESSPTTVKMRGRAAGLVTAETHPVLLQEGDVLQAVVRRNDRNGQPSLLETVPWTFIVAHNVQREHVDGFVFTGVRGGLEGRRNSRTQRLAMLVKTQGARTELQVVTQNAKDKPLAATQIFERLPGGDKSEPIGRTDWRGIMRLPNPKEQPIATLRIPIVKPAAETATDSAAPADAAAPANTPPADAAAAPATSAPAAADTAAAAPTEAEEEVKTVKLRVPLMIYYVKNGETLLARLPVVLGLSPVVTAEVPDDSRRLQAEGLMKGFQSEVVDVVAARQIGAARVRLRIDERKLDLAQEMLDSLRKVKDYDIMARELDAIEKRVLDKKAGDITPVAQMRIEKMFQQTRELLQKYLQNDLVKKVERELDAAIKGGEAPAETPAPTTPVPASPTQPAPSQPAPATPQNPPPQSGQPAAP
ncbi:MAG: hypothetical protein JNK90_01020, partial [Planctomycetaceae bacterium]|nr:hypothetical protein [Planctomycetaceae bacterium]